jgi:cytochrome c-type biogenesis protein CcmH
LSWALLGLVLVVALVIGSQGESGPPTAEQRVKRITSVVRCPTCRGLSVAQSEAPAAKAIDDEVRRRVEAGETDRQIKDYLVSRYSEDILLQPRSTGAGLVVWALPVIGALAAVGGLVFVLRRRRVRTGVRISDADQALVDQALRS